MFGKMDPKAMEGMMKKMGIKTEPVEAEEVIIRGKKDIVIKNPQVTMVEVQGQKTFQIVGRIEEREREAAGPSKEDIRLVMEQTGASEKEAAEALGETGDLAEAIAKLKS
jgi:nascent polypeptide-associated complex subunit alpha